VIRVVKSNIMLIILIRDSVKFFLFPYLLELPEILLFTFLMFFFLYH